MSTESTALPAATRGAWGAARPWAGTAARILLGIVWIVAGSSKVTDLAAAVRSVRAYQLLPEWAVPTVGAGLPFLEIALGSLLVIGLGVRLDGIVSLVLFAVFITGIVSASVRGLRIDCGCFSAGGELGAGQLPTYGREVLRDVGFLVLAGILLGRPRTRFSVDGLLTGKTA